MIDDMTLGNLSPTTQRSYLHAVTKFSRYFGRSPIVWAWDARALLGTWCRRASPARRSTRRSALRFFHGVTLDRLRSRADCLCATPRKLPAIRSADEVVRSLEAVPSLKATTALTTAYATGLGASERSSCRHSPRATS
ncbi:Putative integrase/recombinase y4qK (fragment) [Sinorhizobium medicae]|uniref:Integrase/recombinase y4qK n=1 Tax=Sinorhizobium medicae TaxID=110321 RepID=A0A508WQR9_9HYPH